MSRQNLETLLRSAGNAVVPYARDVREGYHEVWRTRQG
jgi:hypothetical protein